MKRARKLISVVVMCTTFVFLTSSVCRTADLVQPTSGITKHSPEVRTSPEQEVSKMRKSSSKNNWIWWALGAVVVIGGIAAAAGGGGGGGGGDGDPAAAPESKPAATTGSATVTW